MVGDIFGALLGAAVEGAVISGSNKDDNKSGAGCLFLFIVLIIVIVGAFIHFGKSASTPVKTVPIKGKITHKLEDNTFLVVTTKGEKLYQVSNELYLNKNVNDSIVLTNNMLK